MGNENIVRLDDLQPPPQSVSNYIIPISLTTGATPQRLLPYRIKIKAALIQNISLENVTIYTNEAGTAGQGIILNAATGAGSGGASVSVTEEIDLYDVWFVRTTAGVTLSIWIVRSQIPPQ